MFKCFLDNSIKLHIISHHAFYINFRGYQDAVAVPHFNHIISDSQECMKRLFESIKTTFQTFHHMNTEYSGKHLSKLYCIAIFRSFLTYNVFNSTITSKMQSYSIGIIFVRGIGKNCYGIIEQLTQFIIQLIYTFIWLFYIREMNTLTNQVCLIFLITPKIFTSSTNKNFI